MPIVSLGDGAQQFVAMRNSGSIKTELSQLAESLSSGRVTDISATLGGETTQLSGINYSLAQADGYLQVSQELGLQLGAMQLALGKVDGLRGQASADLLLITDNSSLSQVNETARASRGTFDGMVRTLNTQRADRALFGGAETGRSPLASADDMLADMTTAIGGATTEAAITAAVEFWFDDPAGGFATMGYLGDGGAAPTKRVSEEKSYEIDARADDPAVREVLKAAAIAALADELPALDQATKTDLMQESAIRLVGSADGLIGVQSRIGFVEARVDQNVAELSAQKTALGMSKNDLISADPFDTASRLQSVQLQLETHYSVTARLSQLTLLDYI